VVVYFWAWSKKTIDNCNKVMAIRVLALDPQGNLLLDDDEEKTIARFPGRMSRRKMKGAVQSFVELELRGREPNLRIPLENVVARRPEDIDRILGKARPELKALR